MDDNMNIMNNINNQSQIKLFMCTICKVGLAHNLNSRVYPLSVTAYFLCFYTLT